MALLFMSMAKKDLVDIAKYAVSIGHDDVEKGRREDLPRSSIGEDKNLPRQNCKGSPERYFRCAVARCINSSASMAPKLNERSTARRHPPATALV
ncbi:hypothetical protein [Luteibacter sp. OK325]|uniref:hypothetical protein n=1 Tax=Luteibacter sp. OK325 TaxID=2135670 RepID=UPI0011B20200|nr:hypothetical protein [Luteibacter sp. OK325]